MHTLCFFLACAPAPLVPQRLSSVDWLTAAWAALALPPTSPAPPSPLLLLTARSQAAPHVPRPRAAADGGRLRPAQFGVGRFLGLRKLVPPGSSEPEECAHMVPEPHSLPAFPHYSLALRTALMRGECAGLGLTTLDALAVRRVQSNGLNVDLLILLLLAFFPHPCGLSPRPGALAEKAVPATYSLWAPRCAAPYFAATALSPQSRSPG